VLKVLNRGGDEGMVFGAQLGPCLSVGCGGDCWVLGGVLGLERHLWSPSDQVLSVIAIVNG
jgi:hypothetical protein